MATEKYIKVTPKGEKPRIILATLKQFYISQGAKIETPTQEEIANARPNETRCISVPETDAIKRLKEDYEKLKNFADEQAETIKALNEEVAALKEEIAKKQTSRRTKKETN